MSTLLFLAPYHYLIDDYERDSNQVIEVKRIDTGNQVATVRKGVCRDKVLKLEVGSDTLKNSGQDEVTVSVSVLDGLSYAKDEEEVVRKDFNCMLEVDGTTMPVDIMDGTGERKLVTEKPEGDIIKVKAVGLEEYQATSSDTREVEVIQ